MEIYDRQKELPLQIPTSATIIGVGGVGSWVALDLALVGVKKLVLIDPDTVEDTNLNRTPFKISQIGEPKVQALMELVLERRNVEVIPLQKWVENLSVSEKKLIKKSNVVIDCKDNSVPLPISVTMPITGGYDGKEITIFISPDPNKIWGDEPVRYRTVPSYVVPPQFIATMIVNYIVSGMNLKEAYISFSIDEVLPLLIKAKSVQHIEVTEDVYE